jgi:septum formation protein
MMIGEFRNFRIILASRSPRRQQLLRELGIDFEVIEREFDETFPDGLTGGEIAEFISRHKAYSMRGELLAKDIVITADTIVWCNDKVLGKPKDYDEAVYMLQEISGNTHEVITGVTILSATSEKTFSVSSRVVFDPMTREEIDFYIENYQPYDKAGAYGIQEWIGLAACSSIEGSYFNVMGLPVRTLYKELKEFVISGGQRECLSL